jgi:pimeloyl-ACP methyl ester carboxylesterase
MKGKTMPISETLEYASLLDGTAPLYADLVYEEGARKLPLVVVMHGYNGNRAHVRATAQRMAGKGVATLAPDMRGCGQSAGRFDSGGLQIMDIYDAIQAALRDHAELVDESNISIIGYSGGGANATAAATKFPDLFRLCASFFGVSDYALLYSGYAGRGERLLPIMREAFGGTPDQFPERYAARSSLFAVRNAPQTRLYLYWDEEETTCPALLNTRFAEISAALGYRNCVLRESKRGDARRWIHGYPEDNPDLIAAEDDLLAEIRGGALAQPRLSVRGALAVPGFVVTRQFRVVVGDGVSGTALLDYDLSGSAPVFRISELTPGQSVLLTLHNGCASDGGK